LERLRILISGMIAGDPQQGGATWAVLQYVLGLRALGHDVKLVEPVERIEPRSEAYFREVVERFGLGDDAALLVSGTTETAGVGYERLARAAEGADLLLNVSGMLRDERLVAGPRLRAYLDLDPAFNQLWHVVEGIDVGLDRHERFVTVGLALGEPQCPLPTCGREWIKTLPPVVLADWPAAVDPPPTAAFTTVANWRGYGSIDWNGVRYGQKAHSLRLLLELPQRTPERLALALAIHPDETADLEALDRHGWELVDPVEAAGTPDRYRDFVRGSKGELGVAKSGYVASRCGWFSDRTACYLASGRPAVVQDTGFERWLPTGAGLHTFTDVEGARAATLA